MIKLRPHSNSSLTKSIGEKLEPACPRRKAAAKKSEQTKIEFCLSMLNDLHEIAGIETLNRLQVSNKTHGYHQDILRPLNSFKMPFRRMKK